MSKSTSRILFEQWISSSPYERSTERNSEDQTKSAWPGQYSDYEVQLAWEAWETSAERFDP